MTALQGLTLQTENQNARIAHQLFIAAMDCSRSGIKDVTSQFDPTGFSDLWDKEESSFEPHVSAD